MDGLMIDSEPYWAKADKAFLDGHAIPYTPTDKSYILWAWGNGEVIEYYKKEFGLEPRDIKELIDERRGLLYKFLLVDIQLLEGVRDAVIAIYKKNYPLAIATTGHSRGESKKNSEEGWFRELFFNCCFR